MNVSIDVYSQEIINQIRFITRNGVGGHKQRSLRALRLTVIRRMQDCGYAESEARQFIQDCFDLAALPEEDDGNV